MSSSFVLAVNEFLEQHGFTCTNCLRMRRWYDYDAVKDAPEDKKGLCSQCYQHENL